MTKHYAIYIVQYSDKKPMEENYQKYQEQTHWLVRSRFKTKEEAEKWIEVDGNPYREYIIQEIYQKD